MRSVNRRERRAQREVELATREEPAALVAAAANVKVTAAFSNMRLGGTDWQNEGWAHYDSCPEYHSAVNIIAYNLSRARLIGVEVDPATGEPLTTPTDDPDVVDIMRQFFGGPTGQSQALDRLGRHLTVAGDGWCLASPDLDTDQAVWEVLGTSEVTGTANRIMVTQLDGTPRPFDANYELLFRIWRPHPKRRWEADSSTRSLLPVLRELAALAAMVSSAVKSRLAAAGILWIPDDIQLPAQNTTAAADNEQLRTQMMGAEGWLDLLTEAMLAPIQDLDSAQAVVPLVAMAKAESIEKVKHMEFGRDLDATVEPLRTAGLKRLAVGMDMPPEILTGMGTTNHWTSWSITEEFAKAFLAPILELIVDAATKMYLRPALRAAGRDPDTYAVWFDLAALFPRQISVDNAQAAWEANLLSEVAYMAALGFGETDIADSEERARRLVEDMVRRGVAATIAELAPAIAVLFPGLTVAVPTPAAPQPLPAGTAPATRAEPGTEPAPAPARPAPPGRPSPRDSGPEVTRSG